MRTIPFGMPVIGKEEKQAVEQVLSGNVLVHGPKSKEFEQSFSKFTGSQNAISVASCTAALHLAYFYLGLKQGEEVIVPAQTHVATAHAVELMGGKPVFVDAEGITGNIDIDQIEDSISGKTRAISIVHFLGMPVEMKKIVAIAKKHNLFVVEDCALAIGSTYAGKHAGNWGDVGCFSFYPVKHITTAEGGMLITNNDSLSAKITRQKAFGLDRTINERQVPGVYDVNMLGFNYRLNELACAMGIEQMKKIDGILKIRSENFHELTRKLQTINEIELLQSTHGEFQSSYYCHTVILNEAHAKKRFEIVKYLNAKGVGTSVYYPQAVPHLKYYKEKYNISAKAFPRASRISNQSIALPVGAHLNTEDMHYIAEILKEAIMEVG